MEASNKHEWNAIDYKLTLIKIKTNVNLALTHLEPVKGEDIPEDPEFRQTLWVLCNQIYNDAAYLETMRSDLPLPSIDDVQAEQD
ncbi:MAG: hypothetical protein ACM3SR_08105 [Ignavibacteriales bacterium]